MFGIGATEFIILVVLAVLLFGTPILTFLVGYTLGQRASGAPAEPGEEPQKDAPADDDTKDAPE